MGRIIAEDDDVVSITLPRERDIILFHLKHTDVASQLLEGKFPISPRLCRARM